MTQTIAISATFTAEPLEAPLAFWMHEAQLRMRIEFAPFHQVFQQLIDPNSLFSMNVAGVNIILIRVEDWHQPIDVTTSNETLKKIRQAADEFIANLLAAAERSSTPFLVGICPASPSMADHPVSGPCLREVEEWILATLKNRSGIIPLSGRDVLASYPVAEWYDSDSEELGRIPYTDLFFTALGTSLARTVYAIKSPPRKVIAVDCDETLWSGVCGEVGPDGIELTPPRLALQRFLRDQIAAGMLLCVCSKNNEEDVWQVFNLRSDMVLRRDQVTSWRVNWQAKSLNLQSLASELGLGLDSFIFLDDNPIECAEMESNCPEVLTLRLPSLENIPDFLKNVWAFDRISTTEEDRQRTQLYRDNSAREQLRKKSSTMADFLQGLQLEIELFEPQESDLTRIAQLTQRTNQFNCTTIRRNQAELRQLLQNESINCWAVHVSDRFGDYGLVGVVFFQTPGSKLEVDTFLLSCRVLGRGVEHFVVQQLGKLANTLGLHSVVIPYSPTPKNKPAGTFLEQIAGRFRKPEGDTWVFELSADVAASVTYRGESMPSGENDTNSAQVVATKPVPVSGNINRITGELSNVAAIHRAIGEYRRRSRQIPRDHRPTSGTAPRTPVEMILANIWTEVLGIESVGIHDNFFQLGGDSLLATQVVSRVWRAFRVKPPLSILFDSPTIAGLSLAVLQAMTERADGSDVRGFLDELDHADGGQCIAQVDSA